jgi:hypothetical protein
MIGSQCQMGIELVVGIVIKLEPVQRVSSKVRPVQIRRKTNK